MPCYKTDEYWFSLVVLATSVLSVCHTDFSLGMYLRRMKLILQEYDNDNC